MKQFEESCEKLEKVVLSCKTKKQLGSAWNYYKLWEKKYDPSRIPRFMYVKWSNTSGYCIGYILGWLNKGKQLYGYTQESHEEKTP